MYEVMNIKEAKELAKEIYKKDYYAIEYGEGVSGEPLMFEGELQDIYEKKMNPENTFIHFIVIELEEGDMEDKWLSVVIIQDLENNRKLLVLSPYEEEDNIIDYKFID